VRLPLSLGAWGSDAFAATLQAEVASLGPGALPLDGLSGTGYADDQALAITLIEARDTGDVIEARLGGFFTEILAGCSCGDEPTCRPVYGEVAVTVHKGTAEAQFALRGELLAFSG